MSCAQGYAGHSYNLTARLNFKKGLILSHRHVLYIHTHTHTLYHFILCVYINFFYLLNVSGFVFVFWVSKCVQDRMTARS